MIKCYELTNKRMDKTISSVAFATENSVKEINWYHVIYTYISKDYSLRLSSVLVFVPCFMISVLSETMSKQLSPLPPNY